MDSTIWFINFGEICIYVYSYVTYRNPCNALIYSREHILSSIGNSLRYFLRKLWNPSNKQVSKNRIIYFWSYLQNINQILCSLILAKGSSNIYAVPQGFWSNKFLYTLRHTAISCINNSKGVTLFPSSVLPKLRSKLSKKSLCCCSISLQIDIKNISTRANSNSLYVKL